jgi:subtilisin family serine protease
MTAIASPVVDPYALVGLPAVMQRTSGRPDVVVGLLDGPVATGLSALAGRIIGSAAGDGRCVSAEGPACAHGTFVAGVLAAGRSSPTPGICPGCTLLVRPIFSDASAGNGADAPRATPDQLVEALHDCVDAGVHVVNLSAAVAGPPPDPRRGLGPALDRAMRRGTIVVAAAGNRGVIGASVVTAHPWVIPVVAYTRAGRPLATSNLGASIGRTGLGAPGERIVGLSPSGDQAVWSGTSVATPFVSGAIALLRSEFPELPAERIRSAVTASAGRRRSIVPPFLDTQAAWSWLHEHR